MERLLKVANICHEQEVVRDVRGIATEPPTEPVAHVVLHA